MTNYFMKLTPMTALLCQLWIWFTLSFFLLFWNIL